MCPCLLEKNKITIKKSREFCGTSILITYLKHDTKLMCSLWIVQYILNLQCSAVSGQSVLLLLRYQNLTFPIYTDQLAVLESMNYAFSWTDDHGHIHLKLRRTVSFSFCFKPIETYDCYYASVTCIVKAMLEGCFPMAWCSFRPLKQKT